MRVNQLSENQVQCYLTFRMFKKNRVVTFALCEVWCVTLYWLGDRTRTYSEFQQIDNVFILEYTKPVLSGFWNTYLNEAFSVGCLLWKWP